MVPENNTDNNSIWCVIPVYNNGQTVEQVAKACRQHLDNILVIDDGSTDADIKTMFDGTDIEVITHERNMGKGKAIITAVKYLNDLGATYMITIDADGQHFADDLDNFIPLLQDNDYTLVVGCRDFTAENVPDKSKFGRAFSNLWLRLETGVDVEDTQSGFRAYPVKYIAQLHFMGNHYNFEAEVLTKAIWSGIEVKTVHIKVFYPEKHLRVSSFKPFLDNLRFTMMHTHLMGLNMRPIRHKRLVPAPEKKDKFMIFFHPIKLLKHLLNEHATPMDLGIAAAMGTVVSVLPLLGFHSISIIYISTKFHLNRIMAFNIQHLFMPPLTPFICIQVGYYMRHGKWLTEVSYEILGKQLYLRLYEWLLGSLVMAPVCAVVTGLSVYMLANILLRRTKTNE